MCLRRSIELAPVEIVASHHRQHSAGAILERKKGTLDHRFLVEGRLGRPGFHVEGRDLHVDEIARLDQTLCGRVCRPLKPLGVDDGVVWAKPHHHRAILDCGDHGGHDLVDRHDEAPAVMVELLKGPTLVEDISLR